MQKQQKAESREIEQGSHAPLQHVVDPQVRSSFLPTPGLLILSLLAIIISLVYTLECFDQC